MIYHPDELLERLLTATPRPTKEAPDDARGLYGLVDHEHQLRYIGSTSSPRQTLRQRLHQRHRTGSEGMSHYFSHMYNTGRMWRDREDHATKADGDIAKALRNAFIAEHCRAVWVVLPDDAPIDAIEQKVLGLAPKHAIAWNRRSMDPYEEPVTLVDVTIERLGFDARALAAIERQRARWLALNGTRPTTPVLPVSSKIPRPFPSGEFRFYALDVETANNDRASICQIGVACVRGDGTIATWKSYVDPVTSDWSCTRIHGITARTVSGAPTFDEVYPTVDAALRGAVVYQHSSFDSSAIHAACTRAGLPAPSWQWRDSVHVARGAWPEIKGNGGFGLASLKSHLGLRFEHHDAGEDARAAAEIVLLAEGRPTRAHPSPVEIEEAFDVIESFETTRPPEDFSPQSRVAEVAKVLPSGAARQIGIVTITQGNIDNSHIYLRSFFDQFPEDAIGGSNMAEVAPRQVNVDWGNGSPIMTDLDGKKKFFRKRGWIRSFFERNGAAAGDTVAVIEVAPYSYRVTLVRG